ncbi:MAG: transporter [Candidatus Cloacimonetes bacterium HGW-Cloacimonetes-1]|jgi:phospholipid/cholesterol/gamma-HCH transport system permease protein|nr:MAG: transporter [Candidatus Cloacimonetes bacterium HGW-Cloacimonetes-1]
MNIVKIENNTLYFGGVMNSGSIPEFQLAISKLLKTEKPVMVDIAGIESIDSAGVAYLEIVQESIENRSGLVMLNGASAKVASVIDAYSSRKLEIPKLPRKESFFESLGGAIYKAKDSMAISLVLAADIYYWSFVGLFNRSGQRKGTFVQQGVALGVQALPIVALLSFIIGFILALQSAVQLRNFGANIFIADLLAVTMVREMGPILTAIIVAGRSGSAIASEVATMSVTEEIDALKMMAINPIRYVIVPKFHAITLVMPILVAFSILVGEIGGGIIALGYLDLSLNSFISRTVEIITLKDLLISLGKSTFFAWVIVVIGSYFGFQVKGGAEGVGKATTSSVVASIFAVIVFDAMFSLLYL